MINQTGFRNRPYLVLGCFLLFAPLCPAQDEPASDDTNISHAIFAKLKEHHTIEPMQIRLAELPAILEEILEIDVEIDVIGIESIGIGDSMEIEFSARNRSVASALMVALEPLDLGWTIRNETLFVTNIDDAENASVMISYDATGIINIPDSLLAFAEFRAGRGEELVNDLNGEMTWLMSPIISDDVKLEFEAGSVTLHLTHCWHTHIHFETFLERRRLAHSSSPTDDSRLADRKFQQVYPLQKPNEADGIVASVLDFALEGEAAMDTIIQKINDGLVVDATWENHLRVREFLVGVGMLEKPAPPGGGVGGGLFRMEYGPIGILPLH